MAIFEMYFVATFNLESCWKLSTKFSTIWDRTHVNVLIYAIKWDQFSLALKKDESRFFSMLWNLSTCDLFKLYSGIYNWLQLVKRMFTEKYMWVGKIKILQQACSVALLRIYQYWLKFLWILMQNRIFWFPCRMQKILACRIEQCTM